MAHNQYGSGDEGGATAQSIQVAKVVKNDVDNIMAVSLMNLSQTTVPGTGAQDDAMLDHEEKGTT